MQTHSPTSHQAAPSASGSCRKALGLKSLMAIAVGLVVSQGVMVIMLQGVGHCRGSVPAAPGYRLDTGHVLRRLVLGTVADDSPSR